MMPSLFVFADIPSVVIDMNRQGRQSSILIDITLSIYIDSCRLFIFIQIISYFVSTINASLLVIILDCRRSPGHGEHCHCASAATNKRGRDQMEMRVG
jgi:hypothetical protein